MISVLFLCFVDPGTYNPLSLVESSALLALVYLFLQNYNKQQDRSHKEAVKDREAFTNALNRVIDSHETALLHIVDKLDSVQGAVLEMTITLKKLEERIFDKTP